MKRSSILAASALVLTAGWVTPSFAFEEAEREEIETIVREYLLREPELLVEVLGALEEQRTAAALVAQREAIAAAGPELMAAPEGAVLGNPEGDVTIVEFFDYNCGFCQQAHADMQELIDGDPELRFILRESPVLGPPSAEATRVSLAVRELEPERYAEFHERLLMGEGTANEDEAMRIAAELGIEEAALRQTLDSPAIVAAMQESARLIAALQITGTPSYVIGGELVPGAIGAEGLAERVANVRECGEATC